MSPALSILLALLSRVKPEDVAAILKELAAFLDPIIATKGPLIRFAWSILRNVLLSATTNDLTKLITEVKAHPEVAAAATQWAV